MSDTIRTWGELDADGALQESVAAVAGGDRAEFLRKAAFGGAAVLGAGGLAGLLPSVASAATPRSDVAILNFALTLEYLEAAFYAGAPANAGIFKGDTRNFVDVVAKHEATHVAFLKKALGSAAVKKPTFDFKGTNITNQKTFQATAQLLEDGRQRLPRPGRQHQDAGDRRGGWDDRDGRGSPRSLDATPPAGTAGPGRVRPAKDEGSDSRRRQEDGLHHRLSRCSWVWSSLRARTRPRASASCGGSPRR